MNILDFQKKKLAREKITVVTCYDYTSARIAADTDIDVLLVGDSLAMTMHGFKTMLPATIEMMVLHTAAVARGAPDKFILGDMPFLSFRKSLNKNVEAAGSLIQAGANAIKLEGAHGNLKLITHLVNSGIPVMGHLGLTPQSINNFGGFKVQAKTEEAAQRLQADALSLQDAGCFALLLEGIPTHVAQTVTTALDIPTIGIGAGHYTDGQVLVWQDLLGLNLDFKPKFVKQFINGAELFKIGINDYIHEVKQTTFPNYEHSYTSPSLANVATTA